jgi:hypothetical protein
VIDDDDRDDDSDNKTQPGRRSVVVGHGYTLKPDGSIEFRENVPEHIRRKIVEQHERQLDRAAQKRALWGEIGPESMTRLAKMFPSLRDADGIDPWDSLRLLEWLCGPAPTSGSSEAALFVLGVWHDLDWGEAARQELPERACSVCGGLGRIGRELGDRVLRGAAPDSYVRNQYDDDGQVIGQEKVATQPCDGCDGKGRYVPSPGRGRFSVFRAMGVWDQAHREAFLTWAKFPFFP